MDEQQRPTPNPASQSEVPPPGGPPRSLGGRFFLLDRIGAGGGAVVVRARDRQFAKDVAIKLLRSRDPDLQQRFARESEVLRELDHPAIVRVLAHDRDGDDLYTALELIEGPDLGEHLLRVGPLPWRQVVEIGARIAGALEAVHREGLVHRDVKPANIMLADGGEPLRVKLIDFGIVRCTENYRRGAQAAQRRPTDVGKALGTPGYLPLEAGLVPADARFDVFSLGVTLYELLTGTLPEVPPRPLRAACSTYDGPDDLDLVLAAALALEPEDRTQSAAELGRALVAVRAAHPEGGAPPLRIDERYELIGLAGTGAKGEAYLAVHRGTGHDVILKFLRSEAPDDVLRFAREAQILRTFDHPALPRFYDYALAAKPPYIAMAHAPGEPAVRLCSPPRLKPLEVARVGLELAQVLAVLHARGVLHRDINANNVLIDARGAVTLIDFGCAEFAGDRFYHAPAGERRYWTPPEARVKLPDGGIGKLAWSAPETRGGEGWSEKSDVYSLAHLMFRLLTGRLPIKGADPPTSPLTDASTCPDELATAIVAALGPDPRDRPTATRFAEMLRFALETEEEALARVRALPIRTGRPALHVVPDPPSTEQAALDADSQSQPIPEPVAPPSDPIDRRAARAWPWLAIAGALALIVGAARWWSVRQAPLDTGAGRITAAVNVPAATAITPPPVQAPPSAPPTSSSAPLPTMQDALGDATADLRRCSALAGETLVVEFTTTADSDRFAAVTSGSAIKAVDRCVHAATADIRFQPQEPAKFTQEYPP